MVGFWDGYAWPAIVIVAEIVAWRNDRLGGPMTMESAHVDRIVGKVAAGAA